jgi:hypothetical protein
MILQNLGKVKDSEKFTEKLLIKVQMKLGHIMDCLLLMRKILMKS